MGGGEGGKDRRGTGGDGKGIKGNPGGGWGRLSWDEAPEGAAAIAGCKLTHLSNN